MLHLQTTNKKLRCLMGPVSTTYWSDQRSSSSSNTMLCYSYGQYSVRLVGLEIGFGLLLTLLWPCWPCKWCCTDNSCRIFGFT